jgi:hypothetical protein
MKPGTASRLTIAALLVGAAPVDAQSVRISGVTSFQYLDVRPLAEDSVPVDETNGSGILRRSAEGYVVRCIAGDSFCRYRRPTGALSPLPAVQDLDVNAWGFGRGVRAYARLRGRGMVVGDEAFWPRSDELFDVLAAYVEVNRSKFRGRVGRQWATGLGYHNFDGVSLLVRPSAMFNAEAYAGRSLAKALNEPLTSDELLTVEPFAPDVGAYILGGRISARPSRRGALTAMYEREIRTDRLGLYAERASVDGMLRVGAASIDGEVRYDFATGTLNDARLRAWLPRFGAVTLNVYARHHDPFFELWTIWGAFNPLSFREAGVSGSWRKFGSPFELSIWGAGRQYQGPEAENLFGDVRSNGYRFGTAFSAAVDDDWTVSGQYRAEVGFGAAKSDGTARLQRSLGTGQHVAINLAAFQRLYELRVEEGTVLAIGGDAAIRRGPRFRVVGSFNVYRHRGSDAAPGADWTQLRGSLRLEWTVGAEPGIMSRTRGNQ